MKHPNDHYYLVKVSYLGFRYHGWQKQPQVKTVQGMIEKTINYVLEDKPFKVLGASRTDAMVSANCSAFQLILRQSINEESFLKALNVNLPADISALSVESVPDDFNVIQDALYKEYLYLFSYGDKIHPFSAPFIGFVREELNINAMKEAAQVFVGEHDFSGFCEKSEKDKSYRREVLSCEILANDLLTGNFMPKRAYIMRVKGKGFLRYQVRYIMGALFEVGTGKLTLDIIAKALKSEQDQPLSAKAPASGLVLNDIVFK